MIKIAETFNNFSINAVSNLNILPFVDASVEINHIEDPILCRKSLRDVCTSKFLNFLIPFCQNINAVSGKDMVHSTV